MRPAVGKALSDNTEQRMFGALLIVNPKCDAVVVAEIALCKVAVQVLL
jgi:hypothetical protein